MSDSVQKYFELLECGKIQEVKQPPRSAIDMFVSKKEKNIMDIINLCRTVSKHELDFEIVTGAMLLINQNPGMCELQAIQISMSKLKIT